MMVYLADLYNNAASDPFSRNGFLSVIALGAIFLFINLSLQKKDGFAVVNAYPRDWMRRHAHDAFIADAKGLILEGFGKFKGPFRIITTLGSRVILPAEYTEWLKKNNDLDHQAFVSEEFFAGYPGFEGVSAVSDPSGMLISVVKNKLAQNSQIRKFYNSVSAAVLESWGEEAVWHDANWTKTGVKFIGFMSASVFVGDELAQNPTWQQITTDYAVTMFMATRALRAWPRWTRPFVHWFLPACRSCRAEVKRARRILRKEMHERANQKEQALFEGNSPRKYEDTITWMEGIRSGRSYDAVAAQLGFAMAALVTTSELLKQVLINVCVHSELIEPLRKEIENSVRAHGWTIAGLFNMQLLDSFIKETQRLSPGSEVNLERKALRDVRLPNGQLLPQGTIVSVHTSQFRNPDVYENPDKFDGYRFVKLRQEGGKWTSSASAVSTNADHFVFGMGRPICPGRFFAIAEIKTALAVILSGYDMRLKPGYTPKTIRYGFEILADPAACVEVKRRSD